MKLSLATVVGLFYIRLGQTMAQGPFVAPLSFLIWPAIEEMMLIVSM